MDFLERAAEVLRQARKLPPGEARNELRQVAVALRWLAEHPLLEERAKQISPTLESWRTLEGRKRQELAMNNPRAVRYRRLALQELDSERAKLLRMIAEEAERGVLCTAEWIKPGIHVKSPVGGSRA